LSATVPDAEAEVLYADSSALVKLVVEEPESEHLLAYLGEPLPTLVTSGIAVVEVTRAVRLYNDTRQMRDEVRSLLDACGLVEVSPALLRRAANLGSERMRALDSVHLASIMRVQPDKVIVYDQRLAEASAAAGFAVVSPGR
jgi:uncharacterized protein